LAGGGGWKRVWNFAVLIGRVVMDVGSGRDSISVSFSRGMAVRREAGRSTGEQATITCRRWVFEV
jgi:threonine aldolase